MDPKNEFLLIFNKYVKREGADKLLAWLEKSDFFVAPASTKFHGNHPGGLCEHSLNVYHRLKALLENEKTFHPDLFKDVTEESIAIITLLHDLCKVDFYKQSTRNVKINGEWESVPYYTIEDSLPYGHGEKSVYIISGFMRLTREEAMCINWHMGGFDKRVLGGDFSMSAAFEMYPLACLTHIADMQASYFDEERNN